MLKSQSCFFGEKRNKTRKDIYQAGPNLDRSRALVCFQFQTDVIAVLGAITFTPETKGRQKKVFFFFGGGGDGPEVFVGRTKRFPAHSNDLWLFLCRKGNLVLYSSQLF